MFWDAYNATITDRADVVLDRLGAGVESTVCAVDRTKGFHGFVHADVARDYFGKQIFRLMHGGQNPRPHVQSLGVYSQDVARAVRKLWPSHSVTRADSAGDWSGEGVFDGLSERFAAFASKRGLRWSVAGDWRPVGQRDPDAGRTFYVGSRQSLALLRVYEKGLQVLKEYRDGDDLPDRHWVRVELELKPQTPAQKASLALITPATAWGVSSWTREAAEMVGHGSERVIMWQAKQADADRAVRFMLHQYRNHILSVAGREGGLSEFPAFMEKVWQEQDASVPRSSEQPVRFGRKQRAA